MAEPIDEPVEGRAMGQLAEPAQEPEFQVVLKSADQSIRAGQVQNEAREVSAPQRPERIAPSSSPAIGFQPVEEARGINRV